MITTKLKGNSYSISFSTLNCVSNSKIANLAVGLLKTPVTVFITATIWSLSGHTWILPSIQLREFTPTSQHSTNCLFWSCTSWFACHLVWDCSWSKYSPDQRLQKCWRICSTRCHFDSRLILRSDKSGSGYDINESPMRKWPAVRQPRSFGSGKRCERSRIALIENRLYLTHESCCLLECQSCVKCYLVEMPLKGLYRSLCGSRWSVGLKER